MALTDDDLQKISQLMTDSFQHLFMPYVDAKIDELRGEMNERFAEVNERFAEVNERFAEVNERFAEVNERFAEVNERFNEMNEHFAAVHERIDDSIALNGRYFNDCASKNEHRVLEKRVKVLELAA